MIETFSFEFNGNSYTADLTQPRDISIPLRSGDNNPNCYHATPPEISTIRVGDFIGSVKEGGSVNHRTLYLTPHGNGTHTECYGHISHDENATLNQCLKQFHFLAQVLTVTPALPSNGDRIIDKTIINDLHPQGPQALVLRTLPNDPEKLQRQYSGTNPPYLTADLAASLAQQGIQHLLVDLPSVDPEVDSGKLAAHKAFWGHPEKLRCGSTITELIFVPDGVEDGLYLLNLQITSLESDASPSKPVLYPLI